MWELLLYLTRIHSHNESQERIYTRRACLESVAEIFDDLLLMIHDEDDDSTSVLHSHLSVARSHIFHMCSAHRTSDFH